MHAVPRALFVIALVSLHAACRQSAEASVVPAEPEFSKEAIEKTLDEFLDRRLQAREVSAAGELAVSSMGRLPREIELSRAWDQNGSDGFRVVDFDDRINFRLQHWTHQNSKRVGDLEHDCFVLFSSGCGNCGGYFLPLRIEGEVLKGELYRFSRFEEDRPTGVVFELRPVN